MARAGWLEAGKLAAKAGSSLAAGERCDSVDLSLGSLPAGAELLGGRHARSQLGERAVQLGGQRADRARPRRIDRRALPDVLHERAAPAPAVLGLGHVLLDERHRPLLARGIDVVERPQRSRDAREALTEERDELDLRMDAGPQTPVALDDHVPAEHVGGVRLVALQRPLGTVGRAPAPEGVEAEASDGPVDQPCQQRAPERRPLGQGVALRRPVGEADVDDRKRPAPGADGVHRVDTVDIAPLRREPALADETLRGHVADCRAGQIGI